MIFKIQNSVNIQHSQRVFDFFFFFRKVVGVGKWIEYERVLQIVENCYVQKRGLIPRLDMLFSMVTPLVSFRYATFVIIAAL